MGASLSADGKAGGADVAGSAADGGPGVAASAFAPSGIPGPLGALRPNSETTRARRARAPRVTRRIATRVRRPGRSEPLAKAPCVSASGFATCAGGRTGRAGPSDGAELDRSSWIRSAFRAAWGANGSMAIASSHTLGNRFGGALRQAPRDDALEPLR